MTDALTIQLMFQGQASDALALYETTLPGFQLIQKTHHGPNDMGDDGQIKDGRFSIGGMQVHCFDSPIPHDFDFTPSISLCLSLNSREVVSETFEKLADGGTVLMPLDRYDFSHWFGWVKDRFGVSWQLSMA
ncbi:VOC family protein [Alcanivorax sp.]|uniref:VOC family protein n=1 Tax=Alcanivorax sp. TaxID=1872427 RepID=UPI0032D92D69